MRRTLVALGQFVTAPAAFAVLASCSALNPTGTSSGLSQNEANALAQQIAGAFQQGVNASTAPARASARGSGALADGPAAVPVNVQVTQRTNCTAGGRIEVSGSLTGTVDNSGSGTLFLQVLETITDWQCISGWIINGDPYLSGAGNMSFSGGNLISPAIFEFGGAFKWGTGSNQTCPMNYTITINPDGSGRMQGVICTWSVDISV